MRARGVVSNGRGVMKAAGDLFEITPLFPEVGNKVKNHPVIKLVICEKMLDFPGVYLVAV